MAMTTTNKQHFHLNAHAHKRSAVLMFLFFFAIQVGAQDFSSTSAYRAQRDMQPQMVQSSGYQTYQSTIYEPFSNETPSSSGNEDSSPSKITNRKNGFVDSGEHGREESPIGEAWSLLIFAAIGAGVIFIKQRKNLKAKA